MSLFAEIDSKNICLKVIEADQNFITIREAALPRWILTFSGPGGAGIGYTYYSDINAFIPPSPYPSWVLDKAIFRYVPPVAMPDTSTGNFYMWDEPTVSWKQINASQK